MFELRLTKALICIMIASFPLFVGYQNIIDYDTNYLFLQHTMKMDTIFPDSMLKVRAIDNPFIWQLAYAVIIFCELLTGLLFLIGGLKLLIHSKNPLKFKNSKTLIYYATFLGLGIWFFGFMVIAGEWFASWQSSQWNATNSAFRIVSLLFLNLIFISQAEQD